jgi:hypothetical protein
MRWTPSPVTGRVYECRPIAGADPHRRPAALLGRPPTGLPLESLPAAPGGCAFGTGSVYSVMMNQPVSAGILHSYGKRVVIFESQTDDRIERAEEVERLALMRVIIDQPTSGAPAAVATAMTTVTSALTAWSRELRQVYARACARRST